jgi:large subunit ribosomal protein L29
MKATDLREKSVEDLSELRKTLQRDVFQNRLKNFTNRLDDTSAIRKSKRDLARVITLLHERELGIARAAVPTASPSKGSVGAEVPEAKPSKPAKKAPKAEAKSAHSPGGAASDAEAAAESKPAKKAPAKKAAAKKSEAK